MRWTGSPAASEAATLAAAGAAEIEVEGVDLETVHRVFEGRERADLEHGAHGTAAAETECSLRVHAPPVLIDQQS